MATIIEVSALRYAAGARLILDLPDWRLEQGEHCLVLGPSGSGKTTLLHLVAGFLKPHQGQISLAGQLLSAVRPAQWDAFRGRYIGVVLQNLHLLPALTVTDNLRLAQYLAGLPQDKTRLQETLEALKLADKANRRPHQLSQGEAQRVAIARAVINRPTVILADEPTSALDDGNCERVLALLFDQVKACGATLVVATHDARIKPRFQRQLLLGGAL